MAKIKQGAIIRPLAAYMLVDRQHQVVRDGHDSIGRDIKSKTLARNLKRFTNQGLG